MNDNVQTYMAALTSWAAALIALSWQYQGQIMFVLGLILMIARLVQEVPRAYKAVKEWLDGD